MTPSNATTAAVKLTGRKVDAVLRAARVLFLEHGYAGTSMDAVADKSGVSKATIYVYFKNKKELFAAVISDFSSRYATAAVTKDEDEGDFRASLTRLATALLSLLLAPDVVEAHRIVIAEARRSPELGRLYYESGPARLREKVERIIKLAMKAGRLRNADAGEAAEHFIGLVKGNLRLRALVCPDAQLPEKTKRLIALSGVDVFYRAYGAQKTDAP